MENKLFEIRDRATFIPCLAIRVSGEDGYLMRRAGFGDPLVILVKLATMDCQYDIYAWGGRTMPAAHNYIAEHWDELISGGVVDAEFILGESTFVKMSEEISA